MAATEQYIVKVFVGLLFWRQVQTGASSRNDHSVSFSIDSGKKCRIQQQDSAIIIQNMQRGFLVRYDQLMDKYGEDPISFKVLLPSLSVTTRCIHRFRRFALMHWLNNENNSCPLCRTEHPLYEPLLS